MLKNLRLSYLLLNLLTFEKFRDQKNVQKFSLLSDLYNFLNFKDKIIFL